MWSLTRWWRVFQLKYLEDLSKIGGWIDWFSRLNQNIQVFWIFVLAFAVRLLALYLLIQSRGVLTIADAADYIQFAEYILDQGIWVTDIEGLRAHAGPGYPVVLALNLLLCGPDSFYLALILNCIFSAASVVIVYKIAREFLSMYWSFLAMTWYIIFIPQIWQVQFLGKESLVFYLFTFSVYAFIKFRQENKLALRLVLSFLFIYTLLIHSDERYFFYFPFGIVYLLAGSQTWKHKIIKVSILLGGMLILMLPWTIRNANVYGRPIILTERTAKVTDRIFGFEEFENNFREKKFSPNTVDGKKAYSSAVDSIKNGYNITDSRYEAKLIRSIKNGLMEGVEPRALSKREEIMTYAKEFWRPYRLVGGFYGHGFRYMEAWNTRRVIISIVQYGLLLPLFLAAIILSFRQPNSIVIYLVTIIVIHFGIHTLIAHAITRYRYPIDPLIILLSFWALSQIVPILLHKRLDL